jgi:hypothetical protein
MCIISMRISVKRKKVGKTNSKKTKRVRKKVSNKEH